MSVLSYLTKEEEHQLSPNHHLVRFIVAYVDSSSVGRQEIGGHHILLNVRYEHIDKAYAIVFLNVRAYLSRLCIVFLNLTSRRKISAHIFAILLSFIA